MKFNASTVLEIFVKSTKEYDILDHEHDIENRGTLQNK
jgi:hypothetical protein